MDDLLISSVFVYELDETLAHYELRGEISKKIGYALAQKYDRLIFRAIAKGARQASPISKTGFIELVVHKSELEQVLTLMMHLMIQNS